MLVILFFCLKKLLKLKYTHTKLLVVLFYIIIENLSLYAIELEIEVIGKTTRQNNIDLPNGKKICIL